MLTPDAVAFLIDLENEFAWRRGQLLEEGPDGALLLCAGQRRPDHASVRSQIGRAPERGNGFARSAIPG